MAKSNNSEFHSSSQKKAAELQNIAAHAHNVAEHGDDSSHLTAHEQSRREEEHHVESTVGHGIHSFGHQEISALAFELWEARGCPEGSADEDWAQAVKELRSRNVQTRTTHG
jgi:hypothetical protein